MAAMQALADLLKDAAEEAAAEEVKLEAKEVKVEEQFAIISSP